MQSARGSGLVGPMTTLAPPRPPTGHIYYTMTKSLCATCKRSVDAKVVFEEEQVFFLKFCPDHGHQRVLVSTSRAWYLDALGFLAPNTPPRTVKKEVSAAGCPTDCGPCSSHQQKVYLPVIPITSECNLDCPICYTVNKNGEGAHRLTRRRAAAPGRTLRHAHRPFHTGARFSTNAEMPSTASSASRLRTTSSDAYSYASPRLRSTWR